MMMKVRVHGGHKLYGFALRIPIVGLFNRFSFGVIRIKYACLLSSAASTQPHGLQTNRDHAFGSLDTYRQRINLAVIGVAVFQDADNGQLRNHSCIQAGL